MVNKGKYCWPVYLVACSVNLAFGEDTLTVWPNPSYANSAIVTRQTMRMLDKNDVAQALGLIPGVILQKSGNRNEWLAQVRGFNSRQVPVFYDGVPIYVSYDGNLDLGRLLTANTASLEVNKGFTSLLQGPNQMGGAINITSRRPNKPLQGEVSYQQGWSRGKGNLSNADAAFSLSNDRGFLQLSAARRKREFIGLPQGVSHNAGGSQRRLINSGFEDRQEMFKVGFTPRTSDEYIFTALYQNAEKNSPPYTGDASVAARYWQWPQYDKTSYYYHGITHLSSGTTLKSRAWHDSFKNTLLMYNSLSALKQHNGSYSHYSDYSNGLALELAQELRSGDLLSFSLHEKEDVHREKSARKTPWHRFKDRTWSLAGEYQWNITDNLEAVSGVSYDWRRSLLAEKRDRDNHQHAFNWQTMLKHHFTEYNDIALSLAARNRFPTQKERYTTSRPAFNQIALIAPSLRPERAYTLDLTNSGRLSDSWEYSVSLYYNRISDAILPQTINATTIQNRNSGRVNYKGADIAIIGSPYETLQGGLNYGLLQGSVREKKAGKLLNSPAHTLSAWLHYSPLPEVSFTLAEEARSSSYSDSKGSRKSAGFAITQLHMDMVLMSNLQLSFAINNLFDSKYAYSEGFIEEGRSYHAGIRWAFN